MEPIVHDATEVAMSAEEAKEICKLGQGGACCAFLWEKQLLKPRDIE